MLKLINNYLNKKGYIKIVEPLKDYHKMNEKDLNKLVDDCLSALGEQRLINDRTFCQKLVLINNLILSRYD